MKEYKPHVNSVSKEASRTIHLEVLKAISDIIMKTAGPKGSTTMITTNTGAYPIFTKDGRKTLQHVQVFGEIEQGILDQLLQITENIVSRVGDGTSSATRLTYLVFKALVEMEFDKDNTMNTYDIIESFQFAAKMVVEEIRKNGREINDNDIYDICMISTNGNKRISKIIADIYKKYGKDVYIDLKSSSGDDIIIKEYDGLTINKGYASAAYINRDDETCVIRNPRIYVFRDPIDTPELIGLFTRIIYDNIITPLQSLRTINNLSKNPSMANRMTQAEINNLEERSKMIPTVVLCPFMSRDLYNIMESLEKTMYSYDVDTTTRMSKPPVVIITDLARYKDELADISTLCRCKPIMKYIDESVQQKDIEAGTAPTVDNVVEFYGSVEEIVVSKDKTKFINPVDMFEKDNDGNFIKDEDGNRVFSKTYNAIVSFLRNQLAEYEEEKEDLVEIRRLKRRLNGLVAGLVELYIGGIAGTDRDSDKDLADDAIRNCRSAALNGVGRGANFEGYMAARKISDNGDLPTNLLRFVGVIKDAYEEIIRELYSTSMPEDEIDSALLESIKNNSPINLRTLDYENKVLTSIDTDIAIIEAISKIVTIMFTSNQILVSSAFNNSYAEIE